MMEKELQDNLSNLSMPLGMRTEISEIELDKVPDEFQMATRNEEPQARRDSINVLNLFQSEVGEPSPIDSLEIQNDMPSTPIGVSAVVPNSISKISDDFLQQVAKKVGKKRSRKSYCQDSIKSMIVKDLLPKRAAKKIK